MTPEEKQERIAQINARIDVLKNRLVRIPAEVEQLEDAKRTKRAQGIQKLTQAQQQIKEGKSDSLIKVSSEESEELQQELRGIGRNVQKLRQEEESILEEIAILEKERDKLMAS